MINSILANVVGLTSALIVIIAYVFVFALVIISLIRVSRYFLTAGREQKLIRMEIGKLAEEMHQLRQELKGDEKGSSVTKSE
jgi:hypothetical protein